MFSRAKLISLAKGAGLAAAGAVLTYLTQWGSGQEFGAFGPIIAAALAVAANAIRLAMQPAEAP